MEDKIIFKEESYKIIGICMAIHSSLGSGFLEAVYSEVLAKEFRKIKFRSNAKRRWQYIIMAKN